jgi:phosphoribosyl-AMP cyclohydrolase
MWLQTPRSISSSKEDTVFSFYAGFSQTGFALEPICSFPLSLRWTFLLVYDKKPSMLIPDNLKYDDKGLIPAIIQDWKTNEVLMMAYMNAASLKKTVESGFTWFWSRSRQKFWQKGETSGHIQRVKDILYDCDQDTLLIKVEQTGPACHTGEPSCFFRSFAGNVHGEKK